MPINGMTRAASALHYWERRQEVAANNLANVETTGFRSQRVFAQLMDGELTVANAQTDMRAGALKETGSALDLALGGDGFFVVETPEGERMTRGGSFQLDAEGRIVDTHGNPILGEAGPITATGGTITVNGEGEVSVDGRQVGRLRIDTVAPGTVLQHAGGTHFLPDPTQQPLDPAGRRVRQGYLEDSNVGTVDSMVDMIEIQRAYAAVQKAVTTLDGIRDTISNALGRPV